VCPKQIKPSIMKPLKLALLGVSIATAALVPQEAKAVLFD
jgi:hypothetical protein